MKYLFAVCVAAGVLLGSIASAAEYPAQRVVVVSPFPTGSPAQTLTFAIAKALEQSLKQPFIVEPKPGAFGEISFAHVLNSPADGYTLYLGWDGQFTINPVAYLQRGRKPKYDPLNDMIPLGWVAEGEFVLFANKNLPASNMKELVAYSKANPGKVTIAVHNPTTMLVAPLLSAAGVELVQVPYQKAGADQALNDTVAGHVQLCVMLPTNALAQLQAGTIKAIGTVGKERNPFFAQVSTLGEQGYTAFDQISESWAGLFAPKGTPQDRVEVLTQAVRRLTEDPAVVAQIKRVGFTVRYVTPKEVPGRIQAQTNSLLEAVKKNEVRLPVSDE